MQRGQVKFRSSAKPRMDVANKSTKQRIDFVLSIWSPRLFSKTSSGSHHYGRFVLHLIYPVFRAVQPHGMEIPRRTRVFCFRNRTEQAKQPLSIANPASPDCVSLGCESLKYGTVKRVYRVKIVSGQVFRNDTGE